MLTCILSLNVRGSTNAVTIRLWWTAPTTNVDDSPVEDLFDFHLYQRPDTNFIPGEDIIQYGFEDVNPVPASTNEVYETEIVVSNNSWFTITALDFSGNESDFTRPLWVDIEMPNPPTNLFIDLSFAEPKSVRRTGDVYVFKNGEVSPQTLNVPSDANFVIVSSGYYELQGSFYTNMTIGSQALILGPDYQMGLSDQMATMYYLSNPSTGTQDFVWSWTKSPIDEGPIIIVSFYANVNINSPIRDSGGGYGHSGQSRSTGVLNMESGDLFVGVFSSWANGGIDHNTSFTTNVSEIANGFYKQSRASLLEGTSNSPIEVIGYVEDTANNEYATIIGWVLSSTN